MWLLLLLACPPEPEPTTCVNAGITDRWWAVPQELTNLAFNGDLQTCVALRTDTMDAQLRDDDLYYWGSMKWKWAEGNDVQILGIGGPYVIYVDTEGETWRVSADFWDETYLLEPCAFL